MIKYILSGLIVVLFGIGAVMFYSSSADQENYVELESKKYVCENDIHTTSRVYVALLGLNDNDSARLETRIRKLSSGDTKTKAILIYDYAPTDTLAATSADFTTKFNQFIATQNPDEVIIFGLSAGGTILANSAHDLVVPKKAELHTIASPLKGFGLQGFMGYFLGDKVGLRREIGMGFAPYLPPPKNVTVYHHKTLHDSVYTGACEGSAWLCTTIVELQNNNLAGSEEFYYSDYDHIPLMEAVMEMVTRCRT